MNDSDKNSKLLNTLVSPFKYFCLGCYYSLYGFIYPLILIYNGFSSTVYKEYSKNQRTRDKKEVQKAVNLEMASMEDKMKKNAEKRAAELKNKEALKKKKEEEALKKKKLDERKLKERDILLSEINKQDSVRTEVPNTYRYTAKSSDGQDVVGFLVAFTKQEVFNFLESEGYTVYKLETNKTIELLYGQKQFVRKRLKTKDLIFWLTQLSTYLKSSIPLVDAMRILAMQMGKKDPYKKRLFDAVVYQLVMGESFSEALENQGSAFPSLLVNMIKAAERL